MSCERRDAGLSRPLGALVLVVGLLIEVSTVHGDEHRESRERVMSRRSDVTDMTPVLEANHGGSHSRDDVRMFGSIVPTDRTQRRGTVFLSHFVPYDGVMVKIEAHFVTSSPVYLQVWKMEHGRGERYKLQNQMRLMGRANSTGAFYTMTSDQRPLCPVVRRGYLIGLYSPANRVPVSSYQDDMRMYTSEYNTLIHIGDTLHFSHREVHSQFSLRVHVYEQDRDDLEHSSTVECPLKLVKHEKSKRGHGHFSDKTTYSPDDTTFYSTEVTTTDRPVDTSYGSLWGTTGGFDSDPGRQILKFAQLKSEDRGEMKEWRIATGALAGVATVAIIISITVTVYYRRRLKEKTFGDDPDLSLLKPDPNSGDGYLQPLSSRQAARTTVNPAYGVNCAFLNQYEYPVMCVSQKLPSPGQPEIPSRFTVDPGHGTHPGRGSHPGRGTHPDRGTDPGRGTNPGPGIDPGHGTGSGGYEEIGIDLQSPWILKPNDVANQESTGADRNESNSAERKRALSREESGFHEYDDVKRTPSYLELLPDHYEEAGTLIHTCSRCGQQPQLGQKSGPSLGLGSSHGSRQGEARVVSQATQSGT